MNTIDKELLDAFVEEIQAIRNELVPVVDALRAKPNQPQQFEKFGQVIDRIYGTAATLGFKELADYSKWLKDICYKCSQSDNEKGMRKVFEMQETCLTYLATLAKAVYSPEELKKVRYLMHVENAKAEKLSRGIFFSIQRKSVA